MHFGQRPLYSIAAKKPTPHPPRPPINVCYRGEGGKLEVVATNAFDYEDAILFTKEAINGTGMHWNEPVLAVIQGGLQHGN